MNGFVDEDCQIVHKLGSTVQATGSLTDPITDVFTAMRTRNVLYGRLEASAPWGFKSDPGQEACFGAISRGNCWLTVDGVPKPVALAGGDCFLVSPGRGYSLRDHPRSSTRNFAAIVSENAGKIIHWGGGGAATTIICGKLAFDEPYSRPFVSLLPPLIHIRADRARTMALHATLELLAEETASPGLGSPLVVNRLADLLFIHAIRAYVDSGECARTGWLRALADPQIGLTLRAMHESIQRPWTVSSLAAEAGLSRSAFALRFKQVVGESPLEYLTRWRMYKAGHMLRERESKLAEVANAIGYDSDGAFNKAFKRVLGMTPGEFRKLRAS